jgi:GT2 family glycosyltransferase
MDPIARDCEPTLGVVVIGRNEGGRLGRCLDSLVSCRWPVVYVDSGSRDGSPQQARMRGLHVVELDPARAFTAARGRNEGFFALRTTYPALRLVQFLDGDCTLVEGWIERGRAALEADERVAIAAGRRRELHPEASVYNRLCDLEWDTPVGVADECGGDFMARAEAFESVNGFDERKVAGEEPELCARLRSQGWLILRIDAEMTRHDADLRRFRQWWRRTLRAGHAAADNWSLLGRERSRPKRRMALRALGWGLALPAAGMAAAMWALVVGSPAFAASALLLPLLGWIALFVRILLRCRTHRQWTSMDAALFAGACVLGKFPEAVGVALYAANRLRGRRSVIVEYKSSQTKVKPGTPT